LSRIDTKPTSPVSRLLIALARRSLRKLAGSTPAGGVGPLEAYGLVPRLLLTYGLYEQATAGLHRVPVRLKNLAELKAATMSTCPYCIDIGSQIARRSGIPDEQLLALGSYGTSDLFDPVEKLVLDYAVGMSSTPVTVPDELFAELRRHFDDAQIVELTNIIALENMRGRFNHALGFGAAGFSEGMVCAVPEGAGAQAGSHAAAQDAGTEANQNGAPATLPAGA
jgi:AhpD family alkylhydroperoxidase